MACCCGSLAAPIYPGLRVAGRTGLPTKALLASSGNFGDKTAAKWKQRLARSS
jgi:hypothetical protein